MDKVTEAEIAAIAARQPERDKRIHMGMPNFPDLALERYATAEAEVEILLRALAEKDAELATAKAAIEAAPHHQDCAIKYNAPCNCWKSKAKAELVTAKAEIERLEGERLKNWSIELIEGGTTLAVMHLPSRSVIMVTENNDRIAADILWMLGTDLLKALQGEPNG